MKIEGSCTINKFFLKCHRKASDNVMFSNGFCFIFRAQSCPIYIYSAILDNNFSLMFRIRRLKKPDFHYFLPADYFNNNGTFIFI